MTVPTECKAEPARLCFLELGWDWVWCSGTFVAINGGAEAVETSATGVEADEDEVPGGGLIWKLGGAEGGGLGCVE